MLVYKSNRTERLLDVLAHILARPTSDPFQPELVVVHSRGVERWISTGLAGRLGVCANVEFPFPSQLVRSAFSAVTPEHEDIGLTWEPDRLAWAILAVLRDLLAHPAFAPLASYLHDDPTLVGAKAWQLARTIADTFDRYLTYRPRMVVEWQRGEGSGWQPRLWRALAAHLGTPHAADVAVEWRTRLARGSGPLPGLPPRICLFGISTLPPFYVEILTALAQRLEVHLLVPSPSEQYWAHVRSRSAILRAAPPGVDHHHEQGHPLLASFGRLGRDFQAVLEDDALYPDGLHYTEPLPDLYVSPGMGSMLQVLQSDVLHLRHRGHASGPPPHPVQPDDDSISIHSCHGPMRQVEVLQDLLLDLFQRHPDLEPRDVVVMAPDIEEYAPLIDAVFQVRGARHLPYRVADRPLRHDNAVAEAFLRLLELVGQRATTSRVLDLLALEPVRTRYGLSEADLELVGSWVAESGIRWGVDAADRVAHGQPATEQNTWRFGLDRLLLGVAMPGGGTELFAGVLPYDEVEGGAAQVLGALAEYCEALFHVLRQLAELPRRPAEWVDLLSAALDRLFAFPGDAAWQGEQVRGAITALAVHADGAGFDRPVSAELVRDLLSKRLSQRQAAARYLTGQLTFCAMVPLRSVPFRVVCLLGMDDDAFPRAAPRLGFDLIDHSPRLGDRNPRDDDRQLFLEAVLSARDRLLVLFTGQSARTNEPLPPSPAIEELLDVLSTSFERADGTGLRHHLLTRHPLQPFSPRYYQGHPRLFSFRADHAEGARAVAGERHPPPPFWDGPLPDRTPTDVSLSELAQFWRHPICALFNHRLGLWLATDDAPVLDREPIELDGLERYLIASPLLERALLSRAGPSGLEVVRAAGRLPVGTPGDCAFDDLARAVEPLARTLLDLRTGDELDPVEVDVCAGGFRLFGQVTGLWSAGRVVHRFGTRRPVHLLDLWVRHLALGAAGHSSPSHLVTRLDGHKAVEHGLLTTVDDPTRHLEQLLALRHLGLHQPLLFFPETSWAFAEVAREDPHDPRTLDKARGKARYTWRSDWGAPPEGADPHAVRLLGDCLPWSPGFHVPDDLHFDRVALAVLRPLLDHWTVA